MPRVLLRYNPKFSSSSGAPRIWLEVLLLGFVELKALAAPSGLRQDLLTGGRSRQALASWAWRSYGVASAGSHVSMDSS